MVGWIIEEEAWGRNLIRLPCGIGKLRAKRCHSLFTEELFAEAEELRGGGNRHRDVVLVI
jgi:hypothetical protein